MNYYVCLQILICRNRKTFRLHEMPDLPYELFSYVQLCSLTRNLFLMFLILNLNLDLNRRYFLNPNWSLFRHLIRIFLNLNRKIFFRLRGMLLHPYELF